MYAIDWTPRARRQLAKFRDRELQRRLFDAIGTLAAFPRVPGLEALTHHRYGFRLRVGRYRVLVDVDQDAGIVLVREIRKRDERTY